MNLLIDSHAVLWWFSRSAQLSGPARDALGSAQNRVYVSAAVAWELAIKVNLGRLEKLEGESFTVDRMLELGIVKKVGDGVKILAAGPLTRKITVEAHHFSKSAVEKIEKAGGKAQVIGATA